MGDIDKTQYPDHVGPRQFNLQVGAAVTYAAATVFPWFVAEKDMWLDHLEVLVSHQGGLPDGCIMTLKAVASGTDPGVGGTAIAATPDLGAIALHAPTLCVPAAGAGTPFSAVRIPAGYQVVFLTSGGDMGAGALATLVVNGHFRPKAQ